MTVQYNIKSGYNEDRVMDFMKVYREQYSDVDRYEPFDFTLTTFWGEAAESANLAIPRRYIFLKDGNTVGLFQGLVRKILFYKGLRAGSTSGNGLAILPCISKKELGLFLERILSRHRYASFSVFVRGSEGIQGFSKRTNYTFHIHLDHSLDLIWNRMDKKTRNRVRKAKKLGMNVDFSGSAESLANAYGVIASTSRAKGFSSPPRSWTTMLHECFQRNGCESVIAVASVENNDVLSVAHLIGFDKKLILWQAGSTMEGYKSNAGSLVQSKIIEWGKDHHYLIYDMGGTNPYLPVYAGIHHFKSGFGGSLFMNTLLEKRSFYVRAFRPLYSLYKQSDFIKRF